MSVFSERLQAAIKMRGVSQRWVAINANTTEATISRYTKAVHDPAVIDILKEIAKVLNVSADYLIGQTNLPEPYKSIPLDKKILLDSYSRISESDAVVLWALLDKYLTQSEKDELSKFHSQNTKAD